MSESRRNPYETDLDRNAANNVPLTPLSFLRRTASVYPERVAVIHGSIHRSWKETYQRCVRLASALHRRDIGIGDTVAVMAPNTPEAFEAHFGVPMCGAVLNALNIRLDAEALAFILEHGEAKVLLTDREFSGVIDRAVRMMPPERRPLVIDIDDPLAKGGTLIGAMTYEAFLETGDPGWDWPMPADEWQAIALNYTSGTTGNPKGVVYHHRGATLNAMGNVMTWAMPHHPVYLWTLPMFHCNGWCFPWTIAAMAGTNVCLRTITAKAIYDSMADHGVTHFCGAPIIMGLICNAPADQRRELPRGIRMMTAGAAPPAAVIEAMERQGFEIAHVYGLTEVYGPVTICAWHEQWDVLSLEERARLKARQGVNYVTLEGVMVADPVTLAPVPWDGQTMGEIFMRGNTVMKGYLKNPRATEEAFQGGWFHTGDLGVQHPDGYIELKDRSKDIIISGGENISTIEVESVLYRHPAVLEAAVVARPDEKWGETPCAFVTLRDGADATEADIIAWCRTHLAHFKAPRTVVFTTLPKTSTGKIQKFVLREQARALTGG
ncbi:acyl-CoA synthetase [Azospirillum sp. RWY-5-1]|uniref:Acyl-CoA synthetase n=1 Tax=Azospirillum oleiclasticum TaxID=2735135 RepID=A0ABX2T398_9PROT|nr:acyl-CoA synthetase [Azospirillum oleiclasticum]NYZ11523.1 acyl-CoA synthetase [Azospirillum oleiclasticum]NYZ18684.1 acyl-CoA synthetase [Azospirillum oleiclasticum]